MKTVKILSAIILMGILSCTASSPRETPTGERINAGIAEACRQIADDLNIPRGMKVVMGPILYRDPRDNQNKVVGASSKFGPVLQDELTRRGVIVIQRDQLSLILTQQNIDMSALFEQRQRVGQLLSADYIIIGTVVAADDHPLYRATITFRCDSITQGAAVVSSTITIEVGRATSELQLADDFAPRNVRCTNVNCTICGGRGIYDCQVCRGTGIIGAVRTCPACNGQRYTPCTACSETGRCQACQGNGRDFNGLPCQSCNGGGLCPSGCEQGKQRCQACQGKGELKEICKEVNCRNGKIEHKVPLY